MAEREVNVVVNVKTQKADTNIKNVNKGLKATQKQATAAGTSIGGAFTQAGGPIGNLIGRVKSLGISMKALPIFAIIGAVTALTKMVANATKRGAEFAKALSGLEAVTGASNVEMKALSNSAKELGASTQFTAKEVVGLQTEFAKLGFTTKEILNATESTLDLAASLDVGLGEAASIAGSTLRAFGLETKETQRVVDVMAKSTASTALDFDSLRESLKLVAPTSKAMNVSIEETTALLGILADNGLKGSIAGTGLSKTFIELNKKGIPLNEALEKVANSSNQLNTAIDLVGVVGSKSLLTLANSAPKIDKLTKSFENAQGSAEKLAETRLDNLAGDTTKLQSAWEGFLLSIEDGSGIFNTIARGIVQATTALLNFITPTNKLSDALIEQQVELVATERKLIQLDEVLNDTTTSEEDLAKAQEERITVIEELKKEYPDHLANIDSEKTSTEELRKSINLLNKALVDKIIIQKQEEEITEQLEELANARIAVAQSEIDIQKTITEIIAKAQRENIKNTVDATASIEEQASQATELLYQFGQFDTERAKFAFQLGQQTIKLSAQQAYLKEQIEDVNDVTAARDGLLQQLGITLDEYTEIVESNTEGVDENTDATNENTGSLGENDEVITDLIEKQKKLLEQAEKMPGTTEKEIAARNDKIKSINEEIKRLKELSLLNDDVEKKEQQKIDRMPIRAAQTIETQNNVTANLEKQTAKRIRNIDAEREGEERMQQLKIDAAITGFNTIASLAETFAGESEKQQERAFKVQKAANLASALVSTFNSANRAYQSQLIPGDPTSPIRAGIAAGIATAAGLANVAAIAKQKFEAPSKTTAATPSANISGGAQSQAPQFNIVGQSAFNQIAGALNQPIQAYVVAQDVTTAQQLDNGIITSATLGGG